MILDDIDEAIALREAELTELRHARDLIARVLPALPISSPPTEAKKCAPKAAKPERKPRQRAAPPPDAPKPKAVGEKKPRDWAISAIEAALRRIGKPATPPEVHAALEADGIATTKTLVGVALASHSKTGRVAKVGPGLYALPSASAPVKVAPKPPQLPKAKPSPNGDPMAGVHPAQVYQVMKHRVVPDDDGFRCRLCGAWEKTTGAFVPVGCE